MPAANKPRPKAQTYGNADIVAFIGCVDAYAHLPDNVDDGIEPQQIPEGLGDIIEHEENTRQDEHRPVRNGPNSLIRGVGDEQITVEGAYSLT